MSIQQPARDLSPRAALITGPVGSGKTATVIARILAVRQRDPFAPVWVLLASKQQRYAFEERLIQQAGETVFGVETFTFEALYARVLDLLGDPQRMIDDTAHQQILRQVTAARRDDLALFGVIAHMPGFIRLLSGLIHELKQGMVSPEDFAAVAEQRGDKDRDLALIYAAYQDFLHNYKLIDRHGAGWLAVEHLRRGERPLKLDVALLVVDGFDQFNRVNAGLVTALARRVPETLLTLTMADPVPGRSFRRFEQTLAALAEVGGDLWQREPLAVQRDYARAPVLDHLAASLFDSGAAAVPGDASVALIEAPDVGREVGAVLRRIKRLLLDGTPPEAIAVITRDLPRYSGPLRASAEAYGIPLVVREGVRLRENPAVALVLAVLDLARLDFPRRALLDALRSPYLRAPGLDRDDVAWLERISLARQVVRGRGIWLDAVRSAGRALTDEDGERRDLLDEVGAAALAERLDAFFTRITPPKAGTVYDLVAWIEALNGPDPAVALVDVAEGETVDGEGDPVAANAAHLDVIGCVRATDDAAHLVRDINALGAFKRVLHGQRAAHDLLAAGGELPLVGWIEFRAELQLAVERTTVIPPGGFSRLGRVLATTVHEARGLPHDHVFILGLAEGVFPAQERDTGLYQEGERRTLEAQHIHMLTGDERADDMSLFYQAVGLARRSLTLSRFTVDDKGAPVPASSYWRAVTAVVDVPPEQVMRVRVGAVPALDEAATLSEVAVALAALWSDEHIPGELAPAAAHNALLVSKHWWNRWSSVLHGRAVEAAREDADQPFDHFDGLIRDLALRDAVAARLGPGYVWSASQFNEYGMCPFRFFARRLLKLEELKEPEEGLDQLQLGSINHEILEYTYQRIAAEGLAILPENLEYALDILHEIAGAVFQDAPWRYGFRPSAVWDAEREALLRRLIWLVQVDFNGAEPGPFRPLGRSRSRPVAQEIEGLTRYAYRQEASFGLGEADPLDLNPDGDPVLARGVIDRIDRADDLIVVMDYKTGTAPHPVADLNDGRDFQMMLYLVAARELLRDAADLQVVGGLFWHIGNRKATGEVLADDPVIAGARDRLLWNVGAARNGRFIVQPNRGRCAPYCEFGQLCRLSRAKYRKIVPGE